MTVWCKDDIPFPELVIYMHILHTSSHLFSVDLAVYHWRPHRMENMSCAVFDIHRRVICALIMVYRTGHPELVVQFLILSEYSLDMHVTGEYSQSLFIMSF